MRNLKGLIAVLLLFACLCSLAGCGPEQPPQGVNTVESDSQQQITGEESREPVDPNAPVVFLKSDVAKFKLVYAAALGEEVIAEVEKLAQRIQSACNVSITVTDDLIKGDDAQTKEWEHEILIGATNRQESAEFTRDFRESDYGYGYLNGKIVIGAGSEAKVRNAVVMFSSEVIAKHSAETVFYRSEWSGLEKKDHAVERLTVNGSSIKDYAIVYDADSALLEKEMAGRLQLVVMEQTGYALPIQSDAEVVTVDKAFLIGKTRFSDDLTALSANEGCVLANGSNIIAYGEDAQGVVNASKLLTNLLFDATSTEKMREITVEAPRKFTGSEVFSTMTHNLMANDVSEDRVARTMALICKYMPDTVGVQEATEEWMTALREALADYYGFVGEGCEGGNKGEHTAILYAKAKYNLVESGTKWFSHTPDKVFKLPDSGHFRVFTWALLEDQETGARYLHVNTQLDGTATRSDQVKLLMQFLKGYNDVAVVLTGDMNTTLEADELQFLQEQGLATKPNFKELEQLPLYGRGNHVVDWIFATKDCIALTNYITDNNYIFGGYTSDHCSYYAEFIVQAPPAGTMIDHGWEDLVIDLKPVEGLEEAEDSEGSAFGELIRPR